MNNNEAKREEKPQGNRQLADVLEKVGPALSSLGGFLNKAGPYLEKAWGYGEKGWAALQPYHPEEFAPVLMGLVLAFFGGHFVTLIAAVEAYKMAGWERTQECLGVLWQNYQVVLVESKKDDLKDEDNDGIADVKQISKQQLATRKMFLFLKSCDPEGVTNALAVINMGFIAVLATLRVQFARAITLGSTIGTICSKVANKTVRPTLELAMPMEYHKWISPLVGYGCKAVGVSIAWFFVRVLSAFHSAIRGGQMVTRGVSAYATRHGYVKAGLAEDDPLFFAAAGAVALLGFLWQTTSFFSLPFPLNLLLLPLTIAESVLTYVVADTSMFNEAN